MPLYTFECHSCRVSAERLLKISQRNDIIPCNFCGEGMKRGIDLVAKTATLWSGNWTEGLGSNKYSLAAGRKFTNDRQKEEWMAERGFVPESDYSPGYFDSQQIKQAQKLDEQERREAVYKSTLTETGSETIAVEQAWPAKECLDGTIDKIYDTKIQS